MSLSLDEVKRIALLARIAVSEGDAAAARDQLNGIFAMIEAMQQVDTAGVEPMADDLASIALDLLVDERGYARSGPNLLLHPGSG